MNIPEVHCLATQLPVPVGASRLTPRQRLFCERIVGGASGAEAARQAGYAASVAAQQASRMLMNANICLEIDRLRRSTQAGRQAALDRMLSKVEQVYTRAMQDRQCHAALRAIALEAALREQGAQDLPHDISPADLLAEAETLLDG